MKNKRLIRSMLLAALAFGTAWAVRGKFGHEQGAAWAGGIGALGVLLAARRSDWYAKAFKIALASAFGWGIGGMISYGVVVGYARAQDFVNVYYGLTMLFVIGSLYGFLGGGLFGLALIDSNEQKVKWPSLLAEMVAGGILFYTFLIVQLEWFMTPPRSEMWAACAGASVALAWYIVRHRLVAVLRVAVWSAFGAGFGFAFGNFLQVLGSSLQIPFNLWNVMEYSIGFFGGGGMAYGTLTASWPPAVSPSRHVNGVALLLLVAFIPFVVWDQSFVPSRIQDIVGINGDTFAVRAIAFAAIAAMAIFILIRYQVKQPGPLVHYSEQRIKILFLVYAGVYTFLSFLLTGIWVHPLEQYLYLVNLGAVFIILPQLQGQVDAREVRLSSWALVLGYILVLLALLAVVARYAHGELPGAQTRFFL
jgi:hypothetical protein